MTKIGNVEVRNTKDLFGPWTKLCACLWAKPKFGKTYWAAGLDKVTKKWYNKPTLFVAVEAADGGGTMSIREMGVDYVEPKSWSEFQSIVAALQTDTTYAGVVVDNASDLVKRFIQPIAVKMAYEKGAAPESRLKGVPAQGDYQTMGEMLRTEMNSLVNLTKKSVPDNIRKHLLVTALEYEKTDRKSGDTISIGPALPGQMADTASAMFQTMLTLGIDRVVYPDPKNPKQNIARYDRMIIATADGKKILGDRMGIFPAKMTADLVSFWENFWLPTVEGKVVEKAEEVVEEVKEVKIGG